MATAFTDLAGSLTLRPAVPPGVLTASATGAAIDLVAADGPGFAVLMVGPPAAGTSVGGRVQESPDLATWADLDGTEFPIVVGGAATRVVRFGRTARYVQAQVDVAGTSPQVAVAVLVGERAKIV